MAPMTEKEQADVLIHLWQGAAERRRTRQSYEWKIAFGVWAGQIAALGFILGHPNRVPSWFSVAYLLGGLVLVVLHSPYVSFIRSRNHEDLVSALKYESAARKLLNNENLPALWHPGKPRWITETHGFQVAMTLLLALAGPVALNRW
jgi:hypothetical protein